jgi:hypothetical protein
MRCGEHFELEAALDGGGPSQAPRRAASQPPRDPPRRPGTPHSPPPPRLPDRLFRSRVGDGVRAIAARGRVPLCQPPYYPRPGWACASHHIIHGRVGHARGRVPATLLSTAGLDMPGRACRAYPIDLRERLATRRIPSHACRRAALTYYIHAWQYVMTRPCCNARARPV